MRYDLGFRTLQASTSARALHNLRGFAVVIVMAFHSVLAYLRYAPAYALPFDDPPYQWRSFPIVDSARWFGFDLFCAFQDLYLISLMFFLSGLFVWDGLIRRGSIGFLRRRLMRIGLPFALTAIFLMPIAHYPAYRMSAADVGVGAFWQHWLALPFWPTGPAWFLCVLLIFDFAAAMLFWLAPGYGKALAALCASPLRFVFILLAASAAAYIPLALAFTPFAWFDIGLFAIQMSRPAHYAVYFFAGLGVGAYGIDSGLLKPGGWLAQRWRLAIAAATISFVLWLASAGLARAGGGQALRAVKILSDMCFILACGGGSLCAFALVIRFANEPLPVMKFLNENAYGLYLVHYVFVVWLQYFLREAPLTAVFKGALAFLGTLLLSVATVAAARRIMTAARLIAAKRTAPSPP